MPRRWQTAAGTLAAAVLVAGCGSFGGLGGDPGPKQTETRTIEPASAVELATSGALTITTGATPSLRITAGKNVIGHLTSEVAGDRLTLDTDRPVGNLGAVRYELVLPDVHTVELSGSGSVRATDPSAVGELVLSGSGEVRLEGLTTDALTVDLTGSGRIVTSGDATRQVVSIDGSGQYDGRQLLSETAEVRIGGSGTADVTVSGTLDAVVEGSGAITYGGGAKVTSRIDGSGAVVAR